MCPGVRCGALFGFVLIAERYEKFCMRVATKNVQDGTCCSLDVRINFPSNVRITNKCVCGGFAGLHCLCHIVMDGLCWSFFFYGGVFLKIKFYGTCKGTNKKNSRCFGWGLTMAGCIEALQGVTPNQTKSIMHVGRDNVDMCCRSLWSDECHGRLQEKIAREKIY